MPLDRRSRITRAALARRPTIAPIEGDGPRPFWSVMLPTHDDADLLARALTSVLAQDPGPDEMQIEVVDDASTIGDAAAVARELAGDRIQVHRHRANVGASANFTACVQRARGRWVHLLHADDLVRPGFYGAYRATLESRPCAMAVSRGWFIDADEQDLGLSGSLATTEDGYLAEAERVLARDHPVNFASVVVARATYERLGGFDPELVHANDWEMWTRIAHEGKVAVVPGERTSYRQHDASDTTRLRRSLTHVRDPWQAMQIIGARFDDPADDAELHRDRAPKLADLAMQVAEQHAAAGRRRLALSHAAWSLRHDPSGARARTAASIARRARRVR
ncbi:MAG TPA: glycosyltransferase [Acidimicrobiales bacterium]